MKRFLLVASIIISVFFLSVQARAQGNQTVVSGSQTAAVNFPAGGCTYNWTNNAPGIGLAASGTGNIAAFTTVNNGNTAITATITATPVPLEFAYIANWGSNDVSVINTITNKVVATIPVGQHPFGIFASANGRYVYVANAASNDISVISTSTNTIVATITSANSPFGIVLSPDGSRLYVVNNTDNTISVINTSNNTITATIGLGISPYAITISQDGSHVYVTHNIMANSSVSVINTATNTVAAVIHVGLGPEGVVVSPDGTRVYTTNVGANAVSVINAVTNTVVNTIAVGTSPEGISMSPDGSRLYTVNWNSNNVSVINTSTGAVISTIPVGINPTGISLTNDGSLAYVSNGYDNTVSVINTSTNTVISTVPVGTYPDPQANFVSSGPGCTGSPISFTITVQPSSVIPTITAGTATGTISACRGSASASPNIQQFTVSGTGLTNNITAAAPPGFELALSANGVYGNTVTIPQTGGTANNITVYVRSAASAIGNMSGNVTLSSQSANAQNVAVTGTINPLPTVNAVGNQTFVAGNNTTAINFTGTANTFNWTNSNPAIGLPASGTGGIPAFTAVNNGSTPITATITVIASEPGFAYIGNSGDGTVSVINAEINQVISNIKVGDTPIGVSTSPDGSRVYVTNNWANTVSVIDAKTNTVIATIKVGSYPSGITVSSDGSRVYIANTFSNNVSVVNTATNTLIASVGVGSKPIGLSLSPDGVYLYVANDSNSISVINTNTLTIAGTIPVSSSASNVLASPDGTKLYVANQNINAVSVISTATGTVTAIVPVQQQPAGLLLSSDGSILYVTNFVSNTVSEINTNTNTIFGTIPVGGGPTGLAFNSDKSLIYVPNDHTNDVSLISVANNTVVGTIKVGNGAVSYGNFVGPGSGCTGTPITFTITINPTPTITTSAISGTISACQGSASTSPHIGQFTVSGNSLTNGIVATAPPGFQLSLSATGVYSNIVSIPQSAGIVNNITIYVGLAASASGNVSGNVTLTSSGATDKTVAVTGTVNASPAVGPIANQKVLSGSFTKEVDFTGTGNIYNWVNDNPSIGIAYGSSTSIVPFKTTNTGTVPMIGTFTVTPVNTTTGCNGTPVTFTIEVDPILPAVITATGTLSSLSTIYSTPSASTSFSVSGASINAGILVTPPAGFEVSTDDIHFSQTVTVGSSGTINATTVYIRLTSKTHVSSYSGNVILSSSGAANVNVFIPYSTVSPAPLTIAANNVQKSSGQTLTNGFVSTGFTSSGLQNNETIGGVFIVYGLGADAAAKVGTYAGSVVPSVASGGSFDPPNYTITYRPGDIIVTEGVPNQPIAVPNAFTPNGDGINDVWNIAGLIYYPSCMVSIFTRYGTMIYQSKGYAKPWDGVYNGNPLPTGTYYYIINLQNGQQPLSGYVALIR